MSDSEEYRCEECGEEFDSERGLNIHKGHKHKDSEGEEKTLSEENISEKDSEENPEMEEEREVTEDSTDESDDREKASNPENNFTFSLRTVAILIFVMSLSAGFILGFAGLAFSDFDFDEEGSGEKGASTGEFTSVDIGDIDVEGPSLGSSNADMKVMKYTDFSCPFCAEWAGIDASPQLNIHEEQIFESLQDEYIDTGEVEFIMKDHPVPDRHPNSVRAHAAANCAYEQDEASYWEFVDSLYNTQDTWTAEGDNRTAPHFEDLAEDLESVQTEPFMQCYLSTDGTELAETRTNVMNSIGEIGTPSFIVGNEDEGFVLIVGAQPLEEFEKAFEQVRG